MFFDKFCDLAAQKGVSPHRAALEIGLSNSITTKWKKTGATPGGETLQKIADYFDVPMGYLLGSEEIKKAAPLSGSGSDIDLEISQLLSDATPEEKSRVVDFLAGIKAARGV